MPIYTMNNTIQPYAWGSTTLLAALRAAGELPHEESTPSPEAEQWMGSHPRGASTIDIAGIPTPLPSYLAADPEATIGRRALALRAPGEEAIGLPFLFKILTAHNGLSIQSHPTQETAARGFAREEETGIPIDAPHRNYRDRNHKPELICALGDFWALRGFRPLSELSREIASFLAQARTGLPSTVAAELTAFTAHPTPTTWKRAFDAVLSGGATPEGAGQLCVVLASYANERLDDNTTERDNHYWWVTELLRQFPNDVGAFAPLYLNLYHLRTGEALYLQAGVLHAYLYGAGVELMANSDNVLRAGCTGKHIDRSELSDSLTFTSERVTPMNAPSTDALVRYHTPAREFELTALHAQEGRRSHAILKQEGPAIILSIGGTVRIDSGSATTPPLTLCPTASAFIDHVTTRITVTLSPGASAYIAALPGTIMEATAR